jgi:membrane associated rhomboid family serine protease
VEDWIVLHRSSDPLQCEERAFVLTAVGIASLRAFDGEQHTLAVAPETEAGARDQLARYEAESRAQRASAARRIAPPPDLPGAWIGVALYVALLYLVSLAIARGWGPLDAFSRGELLGASVRAGQWWRAVTALTLHRDLEHLLGNLFFGSWIGWFAAARLGWGVAWLATLLSAAAANLFDAALGPPGYRSVGASTAVFAALGILSALGWRERHAMGRGGFARWSPVIAGVILLGWTGSEGANTDLVAHGLGFLFGLALGAVLGLSPLRARLRTLPQWPAALACLLLLGLAWTLALRF